MLHQNSGMGSVLTLTSHGLEYRALQGHVPFPRPIVPPPLPPILGGGAGPQREECRPGAWRPGHIPRETPSPGGKFAQLGDPAKAGSRGLHHHQLSLLFRTTRCGLAGGVVVASQSPGPETQRAGKSCLRGAERGQPEKR